MSAVLVAVVGAESTGKTTLALQVARALQGRGLDAAVVTETLRDFCEQHGRTPHVHEQADIARAHSDRIEHALGQHQVVLADTTALMTAVYSEFVFGDRSLYEPAVLAHRRADLTLLTALDLPWEADGLQRDGPHVREPVDHLVRQALIGHGLSFAVVSGQGPKRLASALSVVEHLLDAPERAARTQGQPRWRWVCESCDDGDCEQQHWLPQG